MSPKDEHDLELVGRLRPEPTPEKTAVDSHRSQLQTAIHAAATDAVGASPDGSVETPAADDSAGGYGPRTIPLTGRGAGGHLRSWRRTALAAAAAVAILGGVVTAIGLARDEGRTTIGNEGSPDGAAQPGPPEEAPCGTELPFAFPPLEGFEGPFPGPSDRITVAPDMSPDTLQLHLRSADATIDVRWPSFPPQDPTTPYAPETPDMSEIRYHDDGRIRELSVSGSALGAGQCAVMDFTVTSDDPQVVEQTSDQIGMALVGPGGPLYGPFPVPLVVGSSEAEALPAIVPCEGPVAHTGGPVDDAGTYGTAEEALAFFLATEPGLMAWHYQALALPDGSIGYVYDVVEHATGPFGDDIPDPREPVDDGVVTVVHVVPRDGGWSVDYWQGSAC